MYELLEKGNGLHDTFYSILQDFYIEFFISSAIYN